MPTWSVHFFLKFLWTRMLWTWHHWRIFFLRFWKNFAKIGKSIKIAFFLKNNSIYSKFVLVTWTAVLATLPTLLCQKPKTFSLRAQKLEKFFFLPEIWPLECSTGHEECLTDEHWVFLQIRFSSEKPSKDIKLYLPPNEVLPKSSSGDVDFVFATIVENFCHKSGISSFKNRKECQRYFFW